MSLQAELEALRAQVLSLQVETTSQREKIALQTTAAVKMAKHIAELRQEVMDLKREREALGKCNNLWDRGRERGSEGERKKVRSGGAKIKLFRMATKIDMIVYSEG